MGLDDLTSRNFRDSLAGSPENCLVTAGVHAQYQFYGGEAVYLLPLLTQLEDKLTEPGQEFENKMYNKERRKEKRINDGLTWQL